MIDVSTLEKIYSMMTPATLLGARHLVKSSIPNDVAIVRSVLDVMYNATGTYDIEGIIKRLNLLFQSASPEAQEQFKQVFHVFSSTTVSLEGSGAKGVDDDGLTMSPFTFNQIVGVDTFNGDKTMGIILSNSPYISPACMNAEKCEVFLNYIPSLIASRMVPVLDVEFVFHRVGTSQSLQTPGLMRYLIGTVNVDPSSATQKIINGREVKETNQRGEALFHASAGMEMFTSPQTLTNPDVDSTVARYVDIFDPFRPLLSIESFNISVTPTVGMFSYKKGTLVIKLHDRSRLCDVSDLIRPNVYQNASTAPTLWITYGWRYPDDTTDPYAQFINTNMLVREAYGIANTQFAFDTLGQVTITLEVWTKGVPDVRTAFVTKSESARAMFREIEELSKRVEAAVNDLELGEASGINKDARSSIIISSAMNESFPDLKQDEIKAAINDLRKVVDKNSKATPAIKEKMSALIAALNDYYTPDAKREATFKERLKNKSISSTNEIFSRVGQYDPFVFLKELPQPKDERLQGLYEQMNAYYGSASTMRLQGKGFAAHLTATDVKLNETGFEKAVTSFGKLASVVFANMFQDLHAVDELQLLFYQFNDHAGEMANLNIAQFPIDMVMFKDQFRSHMMSKQSPQITVEEFFRLVVDSQFSDMRAIGYGFRRFFKHYAYENTEAARQPIINDTFNKGISQEYENAQTFGKNGPFKMPVIEFYIETTYVATGGTTGVSRTSTDPLMLSENTNSITGDVAAYRRVMRIHIFDRVNQPYKVPEMILRADTDGGIAFAALTEEQAKSLNDQKGDAEKLFPNLTSNYMITSATANGAMTNRQIKDYVSKMVPSIIYGANSTSVSNMTLASKQDALMTTAQMQFVSRRSGGPMPLQPNGSGVGGLPMRIIPASMTLTTLGCPLLSFGQMFFVDANTGTTVDNIYGLTGITHNISPGKFDSQMTLTFADAYGKFEGAPAVLNYLKTLEEKMSK